MPPPIFNLSQIMKTEIEVPARVCNIRYEKYSPWDDFNLRKGYHNVPLPVGHYEIREICRDMRYYHDPEHSDGYTYRLRALDKENPLHGKRISIWQDDLDNAVEGNDVY